VQRDFPAYTVTFIVELDAGKKMALALGVAILSYQLFLESARSVVSPNRCVRGHLLAGADRSKYLKERKINKNDCILILKIKL
jgi:hypothetical protein